MRTETGRGRRPGWEPKLVCPDGWSLQVWGGDGPSRELEEKEAGAAKHGLRRRAGNHPSPPAGADPCKSRGGGD